VVKAAGNRYGGGRNQWGLGRLRVADSRRLWCVKTHGADNTAFVVPNYFQLMKEGDGGWEAAVLENPRGEWPTRWFGGLRREKAVN